MLAIMRAESGCDPNADNTGLNKDGTVDIGLLQINSIHGYTKAHMLNPHENIKAGYRIWRTQGYKAWSVYNNGAYAKFL